MNTSIVNKFPFYSSWIGFFGFIFLLIFQPRDATLFGIRPSDVWLWICLILQIKNGYNKIIPFRNRFLVKNFGFYLGALSILSTLIQASYAGLQPDISFIFQFYFFLRFLLIFKFVENLIDNFTISDARLFWRVYTLMGLIVLILSYLEFNDIAAVKFTMVNLYYESPVDTIEEYLIHADRLTGILGNPNFTAILLVSTLPYPLLKISIKGSLLIERIIYGVYILATAYVLVVMTGSRTAIFLAGLMLLLVLIASSRQLKHLLLVVTVTLLLAAAGALLYQRFESEIVVQDRIIKAFQNKEDFQLSAEGFGKWTNRYDLWQDRLHTFKTEGNQLSFFLGLGYTKAYEDYADNGLLSAYINNGLIGLVLKLLLFYLFIVYGLFRAIRYYYHFEIDFTNLAFAFSAFALLLMESTIEVIQNYKLGQLFYLFLSISILLLVNYSRQEANEDIY